MSEQEDISMIEVRRLAEQAQQMLMSEAFNDAITSLRRDAYMAFCNTSLNDTDLKNAKLIFEATEIFIKRLESFIKNYHNERIKLREAEQDAVFSRRNFEYSPPSGILNLEP